MRAIDKKLSECLKVEDGKGINKPNKLESIDESTDK
jgi:hypothetical protein